MIWRASLPSSARLSMVRAYSSADALAQKRQRHCRALSGGWPMILSHFWSLHFTCVSQDSSEEVNDWDDEKETLHKRAKGARTSLQICSQPRCVATSTSQSKKLSGDSCGARVGMLAIHAMLVSASALT